MSPTHRASKDGKIELVTGSPGGSRIITTVLQIIVDVIDYGLNVAEAEERAARPRPGSARTNCAIERGISPDTIRLLEAMGHKVVVSEAMGSASTIARAPDGDADGRFRPAAAGDAGGGVLRRMRPVSRAAARGADVPPGGRCVKRRQVFRQALSSFVKACHGLSRLCLTRC